MGLGELAGISASPLTGRLYSLRASERVPLVEFLRGLGELERRKLYLEAGFSSAFVFCTDHLGLSKSSAFRRTTAARLLVRFPVAASYVGDGRVTVTNLVELRDALSHSIPDRSLEKVIHEGLRRVLCDVRRRRIGGMRASASRSGKAKGRYVPVAVRREVWRRDESRCAFVGNDGRRCGSAYQLESHHVLPFGRGGPATMENLSLRCARHNRFHADEDYGPDHMAAAVARGARTAGTTSG